MKQLIKNLSAPKFLLFSGIVYTLFITYSFLTSTKGMPVIRFFLADKVVHVLIHLVLVFLWLCVFARYKGGILRKKNYALVATFCVGYGIIIEILQGIYTVSREADILDVLANCIGTALGIILFLQIRQRFYNINV
ncbi:VanZ family protein [Cochleicola gelatinilyticus]|uniref:VanZ-like domain-containing protein n=1 Tax=Cochleicola gelatinilyticus TaxID=1763537 RepID=A0A167JDI8_9FLAO|nr:VanZ family protein [Cochleicola gelatinilyticus]OAB80565.1 hypothetical protein ULVI_07495 [Cochleicola gelatinilyticus]